MRIFDSDNSRVNYSGHFNLLLTESSLKETSNYTKTRYGIITSSLEKLIQSNPDYKELLLLICLLDSQSIPKELLALYKNTPVMDAFLHDLKKYSLITSEASGSFSLHRSTQALGQNFLLEQLTENYKEMALDKIITVMRSFYRKYSEESHKNITLVIPHLESLMRNLKMVNLQKNLRGRYEEAIYFLAGYAHKTCTRNLMLAKKYLGKFYLLQDKNKHTNGMMLATLLKDLGDIHVTLQEHDQGIFYCQKSIKLCEKMPGAEILVAENLKLLGLIHAQRNDFEGAKKYFKQALDKIDFLNVNLDAKKYLRSVIYAELGNLYSMRYLNRPEANQAKTYMIKALEKLNASELFSKNPQKTKGKISCFVARDRGALGQVYSRLGRYDDALTQIKEAEYIIEYSLDNCSHSLLRTRILFGKGEIYLRKGQLAAAERELTESIRMREILLGEFATLKPKIYRAEARIRLGRYSEAYEDCASVVNLGQSIFKIGEKIENSYHDFLHYLTNLYHAAVIKQKQGESTKSEEYFAVFFRGMEVFCRSFLSEKEYKELVEEKVFVVRTNDKDQPKDRILQYLNQSTVIFSAIYGPDHPFVRDYVMENNNSLKVPDETFFWGR